MWQLFLDKPLLLDYRYDQTPQAVLNPSTPGDLAVSPHNGGVALLSLNKTPAARCQLASFLVLMPNNSKPREIKPVERKLLPDEVIRSTIF